MGKQISGTTYGRVLRILHEAHPGIVRIKSITGGYVWWPNIDEEREKYIKLCEICHVNQKSAPVLPLHP